MAKFKAGDRVRRVTGNFLDTVAGGEYKVEDVSPTGSLFLEGARGSYDDEKFEAVPDKPRQFRCVYADGKVSGRIHPTADAVEQSVLSRGSTGAEYQIVEIVPVKTVRVVRVVQEVKQ